MQDFDIRWKQRFDNYNKTLTKLKEAVSIISRELHYGSEVDELLQEGLIQRFEYTHELAWNVMKDYADFPADKMLCFFIIAAHSLLPQLPDTTKRATTFAGDGP